MTTAPPRSKSKSPQPLRVRNAAFDHRNGRWLTQTVDLPYNPYQQAPVLLVPKRFLQDLPQLDVTDFWDWGESLGEELRRSLNVAMADDLSASQKVALARAWLLSTRNPDLAVAFIKNFNATHVASAYDVDNDPKGLVRWFERGTQLALGRPARPVEGPDDVPAFVHQLALDFKEEVEERTGWKVLWDADKEKHQREEVAQALAGAMWRQQCKDANVDLSKEVNLGRGPVDFKFSQGWTSRALLELKHIGSSGFFSGAAKQVPQYLRSENISYAVYVAIGYNDNDFEATRIERVQETCTALQEQLGVTVGLVIVDARPRTKVSASRQR